MPLNQNKNFTVCENHEEQVIKELETFKTDREILCRVTKTVYVFLSHSIHVIIVVPSTLKAFSFGNSIY